MSNKTVQESSLQMPRVMRAQHANAYGLVHGGQILRLMDSAAVLVGIRHCRCKVVSACVRKVDFQSQAKVGEMLWILASINDVGRTSMEIGVRVESEELLSAEKKHISSGYFSCVALDEQQKPTPVPGIVFEDQEEKRRSKKAKKRKEIYSLYESSYA